MKDKKAHICKHETKEKTVPEKFLSFFECCLKEDPAPIPEKLQNLRRKLPESSYTDVEYKLNQEFTVLPDMIVQDLLTTFPKIKEYLEELHPLGLMSPALSHTSLEILFSDIEADIEQICNDLSHIINHK